MRITGGSASLGNLCMILGSALQLFQHLNRPADAEHGLCELCHLPLEVFLNFLTLGKLLAELLEAGIDCVFRSIFFHGDERQTFVHI
ncbi:MAG: hypothetical protein RLZZ165_1497 [Bacteroidota bacterium]